jgi:hypothetical protein
VNVSQLKLRSEKLDDDNDDDDDDDDDNNNNNNNNNNKGKNTCIHIQNISYLLPFHGSNGYANAPQCYVILTLPVLFLSIQYREHVNTLHLFNIIADGTCNEHCM